jgi:putative copper export protein
MLPLRLDAVRLFLHITAATVWVGGQIVFVGLLPTLRAAGADVPRAVADRYNRIAWPAFGILVLTGIWNMIAESDHNKGAYAATLNLKMAVVVLSGVAAFLHTRARGRTALAVWGALSGLSALAAVLLGVILVEH